MKLLLKTFMVTDIALDEKTELRKGVLSVNADDLRAVLLKDEVIADVTFDVARPNESVRIIHVLDAVEPRIKAEGPGCCFPGFMGSPVTVGDGVTHRLGGMAVITTGVNMQLPSCSETGVLEFNESVIDMSGEGRLYCACSGTINFCVNITTITDITPEQYDDAVRMVALRTAVYLARCTIDMPCDSEEALEIGIVDPKLPNVAYINQIQSQGPICRTFLYGMPMEGYFTPTLLDPNELMDGAIVSSNYRNFMRYCTYMQQNNPVVRTLFSRHGKEVNFVGMVVTRGHYDNQQSKVRAGSFAAKLAALLKANACMLTLEGTGNSNVDYMAAVQALESSGIAAAPIVHEMCGTNGESQPLFDIAPKAASIVSGGNVDQRFTMPAVDKVIGGNSVKFNYAELALLSDDPHISRTVTAHFYFCGYRTMQDNGLRAFEF